MTAPLIPTKIGNVSREYTAATDVDFDNDYVGIGSAVHAGKTAKAKASVLRDAIGQDLLGVGYGTTVSYSANATISATSDGGTIDNFGATGIVTYTLPPAIAGLSLIFNRVAPYGIILVPQSGDVIDGGATSRPMTSGSVMLVVCNKDGNFQVLVGDRGNLINVQDHGAAGNGVTDDTTAIRRAIDFMDVLTPVNATLYFPKGSYVVSGELEIIGSRMGVLGDNAEVEFRPTADGNLFNFHNTEGASDPPGTGIDVFTRFESMLLWSSDTTYRKTFLRLSDSTESMIRNVQILGSGYTGGYAKGKDTVGIEINGHESVWVDNVTIYASIPVRIRKLSNTYQSQPGWLSADHFNFNNCVLSAGGSTEAPLNNGGTLQHAVIYCDDGTHFSETKFSGSQAWVGGKYGFYCNWTDTAQLSSSSNLVFEHVRSEQIYDGSGYSVYFSCGTGVPQLNNLTFNHCVWDSGAHGVYAKSVWNIAFNGCVLEQGAGKYLLNQEGLTNNLAFTDCTYNTDTRNTLLSLAEYDAGGGNLGKLLLTHATGQYLNSQQVYPPTMRFARKYSTVQYRAPDVSVGNLDFFEYHTLARGTTDIYLPLNSDNTFVSSAIVDVFCHDGYDTQAQARYFLSRAPGMTAAVDGTSPYKGLSFVAGASLNATIGATVAGNQITMFSGAAAGINANLVFKHNLNVANVTGTNIAASINVAASGYPGFTASSGTPFTNLRAGMWIETTGFANAGNNGKFLVLNATGTALQVSTEGNSQGESIVAEAVGPSITMYNVCSTIISAKLWRHEYNTGSNVPLVTGGI
jgi:hypothetical protein